MTRGRTASSSPFALVVAALALCNTGCLGAFIDAGFRELSDDGDDARYAHQDYGSHVIDSMFDDDDDCDHRRCNDRCN